MSFLVNFNSVMNLNVMKKKSGFEHFRPGRTKESFSCMWVRCRRTVDESANEQNCHVRLTATFPEAEGRMEERRERQVGNLWVMQTG